jgi:DNA ligase-associated metallophosphoesterase
MTEVQFSHPAFGCTIYLLPEKAVFIEQGQTLVIADPHFGKSATFRKGGIPIPDGVLKTDLTRLSEMLKRTAAKEFIVLGDFFHSDVNSEWDEFLQWKQNHADVEFKIVPGNHDKAMLPFIQKAGMLVDESIQFGALTMRHAPSDALDEPCLCGHIHPAITLRGKARQAMRLPAFVLIENTLILPAFGSFTGFEDVSKDKFHKAWVVQGEHVWNTK